MGVYDAASGQYLIQPQARVTVVNQPTAQPANETQTLWLLGSSDLAQPQVETPVSSPGDVGRLLGAGTLAQAAMLCFDASPLLTATPTIVCVDVDEKTQATGTIGSSTGVKVTSVTWGTDANFTKWMIQGASGGTGYKITIGSDYVSPVAGSTQPTSVDNVYQAALDMHYTGTGTTPKVTVTDTTVKVTTGTTTTVTVTSVTIGTTETLSQLANALTTADLVTTVDPTANPAQLALAYLDNVATEAVSITSTAPTVLYANVYEAVSVINSVFAQYVTAVRETDAVALPTSNSFTYLTGGTTTTPTNTDWQNAFNMLESVNGLGLVVPLTSTVSVWDMVETHCAYMTAHDQARNGIVGDSAGQTLAVEITNARSLGSQYLMLRWPGFVGTNIYGKTQTFDPFYEAARTAAIAVGTPVTQSLTRVPVTARNLEVIPSRTDVDSAIENGVCITKLASDGLFRIADDVTTWTATDQFNLRKLQVQRELGLVMNDLYQALEGLIGYGANATPAAASEAVSIMKRRLRYWTDSGLLVGPTPYRNPSASVTSGVLAASVEVFVTQALDFALLAISPFPYQS